MSIQKHAANAMHRRQDNGSTMAEMAVWGCEVIVMSHSEMAGRGWDIIAQLTPP